MAPRKKAALPGSKKPNQSHQQDSQPAKFGIQHFFERHTQNAALSQQSPKVVANSNQRPQIGSNPATSCPNPRNDASFGRIERSDTVLPPGKTGSNLEIADPDPRNGPNTIREVESVSQNTPTEDLLPVIDSAAEENRSEVSPEICKSVSVKRFKFSPGMLIKQSQDDGGDEVTWRISPVNERLHAISKHVPKVMRVLADSSRLNQCSQSKACFSPPLKAAGKSLIFSNRISLRKVNGDHDMGLHESKENPSDMNDSGVPDGQSPFKTPPSLSYCHDKVTDGVDPNGVFDQLGSRQHKKALLELLDQVEDALSVEEPLCKDAKALHEFQDKNDVRCIQSNPATKGLSRDLAEDINTEPLNLHFLVLEVSEKRPVDSSGLQCPVKVLRLLNEQIGEERAVQLCDEWFYSTIAPGDTVNVIGKFDGQGRCDVSHESNFLIVHPDTLVSGTRVAAATFSCARRTVLDERLKCGEHSAAALIGTLLHQVFQAGLMRENLTKEHLEEYARVGSKMPNVDFGSDDGVKKVKISEVVDIEEMAWAPKYGLKGMIDASLRVQLIAFTYSVKQIAVRRSDLVGLIMRRNELSNDILKASTTQRLPPMLQAHGGSTESSGLGDMFNPLVEHLTTTHSVFLQKWDHLIDLEAKEPETVKRGIWRSRGLRSERSASYLSSLLLDTSDVLPESFSKDNRFTYRFVRQESVPSVIKAHDGDSLSATSSLINNLDCSLKIGDYVILSTEPDRLIVASGVIMDISRFHVSVSYSKRLRLPRSRRSSVTEDLIQTVWRIDKDEAMASYAIMRFNLVQLFLQSEWSSHLRKMIVDLEAPRYDSGCTFSQDPAVSYIWSEKSLNDDQRRAILKILTAKDYTLILGMPGTGKTSTLVHSVKALLMRGASVLLTSYTNSAVDNLLIKLKAQGIDFVRIGRSEAVHEEIRGHCISAMDIHSIRDIKLRLDQIKVIAVTCLGITSPLLVNKRFDVCIMDEAGQTTLPVSLGPLMFASKFVLVGDHYQLPPLVQSTEARENGMGVSLFCRLSEAHPQAISALQSQYRMCAAIMELSNALIYGDRLRCGSPDVENAKLKYTNLAPVSSWLKEVMDPDRPVIFINTGSLLCLYLLTGAFVIVTCAAFLHVACNLDLLPAFEVKDCKTVNNPIEADIVEEVMDKLIRKGIQGEDIGIITPYNSQANLIQRTVSTSVEIHTIDKYQGRDKDCILVSFVRSNKDPRNCNSSLLGDWHRMNVALTRAKKKLIMVGSCGTLSKIPLLKLLLEKVEQQSGILNISKEDINHKGELRRCSQLR
ncbi:hypothetical protein RJ640_027551 [Escallonia rubra]|uniref:DNA replication ATP-dependent helicase/nuclease n=1 Tax=Escallonia rubra TaxID=112253 RepID=A0AA88QVI7_9ASTE|nr:hypothetical protein RJ640_027551 [Escallonia rubra]